MWLADAPMFLLDRDWWAWNGWIAVGAIVTALMAVATAYLALKSRSEASAARDTVTEIKNDRELTFRPYISWELGPDGTRINAVNLGKGPALNTVFCVTDDGQAWRWFPDLIDFSPGQKIKDSDGIVLAVKEGKPPPRPQVGDTVPRKVAICEDQLGNRYRFLPGVVMADVWRSGENKPDWVSWYETNAPVATRT